MKATENETLWSHVGKINEICMMARSIVVFGSGCFLKFYNLNNEEEHHLTVNSHNQNGDGIKCFRGHSSLFLFAYVENCQQPNIYIKTYPDFQLIVKFPGDNEGYKCLAFSDSSLMFSLGEMPHYKVTAWNWRQKVKFAESSNELLHENQILLCSYGRPMYLAHMGVGSTKLFIWDVFIVCKHTIFTKHEVKLGKLKPAPFEHGVWTTDSFYVIDSRGTVYTVDRDFHLELVIDTGLVHEVPPEVIPSICWFQNGLMTSGPDEEIKYFKKIGTTWMIDSSFKAPEAVFSIFCRKFEKCIGVTKSSQIVAFKTTVDSFSYCKNRCDFLDICLVNPVGEFALVHRGTKSLDCVQMVSGDIVSTIEFNDTISCLTENPFYPFVAVGLFRGSLKLISYYNEKEPIVLTRLHLAEFPLDTIKFFEQGHIFVAGALRNGNFFIMKGLPGTRIEVLMHLDLNRQIADHALVASHGMMRFFAIPVTHHTFHGGNRLIRYCILDHTVVNVKEFLFDVDRYYHKVFPVKGHHRDRTLILVPMFTRIFQFVEMKRGMGTISVTKTVKTGHQIRWFSISFTQQHFISWGFDGFVFVRSLDFKECRGIALGHHRNRQGVFRAIVNPSATVIMTLGSEGVLTAVEVLKNSPNIDLIHQLQEQKAAMAQMFKRPTLCFNIEGKYRGECWMRIQELRKIDEETEICAVERKSILEEFHAIQNVLQKLVNENNEVPENTKLDLLEFYLDSKAYNQKLKDNKEQCKQEEIYLRALIVAQDKVSNYIIDNYYKTMAAPQQTIRGIFSNIKATNYCLVAETDVSSDALKRTSEMEWIEEQRKFEIYLNSQDSFEPWMTIPEEELDEMLHRHPIPPKDAYTTLTVYSHDFRYYEGSDADKVLETEVALGGKVSPLYINMSTAHYRQRQLNTYYQCHLQQAIAEYECFKLKAVYNKCFLKTKAIKEREMQNIKHKNQQLRHIISEFNYFNELKVEVDIVDPQWDPVENVENEILRVHDNEVPVAPYISPSEHDLLAAKAAETERIRLLMLADDFRERALMTMMNGVLEVRWEDELKKEVPTLKFTLEKEPEEYNEDDLRALKDYDEKCVQLQTDREKYKSCLEVDFAKVSTSLRDAVRRFNKKIHECNGFKYYIDAGINQENLVVNRQLLIQNQRMEMDEIECDTLHKIKDYENSVEQDQKTIADIQEALIECRTNMDVVHMREKILEKNYKKDFHELAIIIQDQSSKLYKKRPKTNYRGILVPSLLNELAEGVVSNIITYAMSPECIDYMKSLDSLDMFENLPPTIDLTVWNLICRHRRLRIEYEIRLRTAQLQIIQGEATIQTFHKRVMTKKEKISHLQHRLQENRAARLHLLHNKQVQLVLRRGVVEVPLEGRMKSDFQDAILISKSELERVNNMIHQAGHIKLDTIVRNMKFRRTMMAAEWEHTNLRMRINDLLEQKRDIESVKLTKEMQVYLKNKALGRKKETESYETEVELLTNMYENRIQDKKDKVKKIRRQTQIYRENNKQLDKLIQSVNVDLCDYQLRKDNVLERIEDEMLKARMKGMTDRNRLVLAIQKGHNKILTLQAELELLRLHTFPTFKYRVLDDCQGDGRQINVNIVRNE